MLEIIKEACLSDKDEPLAKGDVLTKKATNKILRQTKKVSRNMELFSQKLLQSIQYLFQFALDVYGEQKISR